MKHFAAGFFCCFLFLASVVAQTDRTKELKINLPSLAVKTFSLQYEQALRPHISGALGVRFGPETPMPFRDLIKRTYSDGYDTTVARIFGTLRTQNFAITPEVRSYFSGTTTHGFYLSLFGRYSSAALSAAFTTVDDSFTNRQRPVSVSGTYRSGGVGVMAGLKWRVREKWVIDWWIAGPMYSAGKLLLDAQTDMTKMNADDKEKLRQDIERGVSIGGQELNGTPTFRNDGFSVSGKIGMFQLRTGLALGLAF